MSSKLDAPGILRIAVHAADELRKRKLWNRIAASDRRLDRPESLSRTRARRVGLGRRQRGPPDRKLPGKRAAETLTQLLQTPRIHEPAQPVGAASVETAKLRYEPRKIVRHPGMGRAHVRIITITCPTQLWVTASSRHRARGPRRARSKATNDGFANAGPWTAASDPGVQEARRARRAGARDRSNRERRRGPRGARLGRGMRHRRDGLDPGRRQARRAGASRVASISRDRDAPSGHGSSYAMDLAHARA